MFFSEYFNIDKSLLEDYGAINMSITEDLQLFIDPMFIFNSDKEEYKKLHTKIIEYFQFLSRKAEEDLNNGDIERLFAFHEIPQNYLGFSKGGNKGLALGKDYAHFLYDNIKKIFDNDISSSYHIEKIMLLKENQGQDKISDMVTNIIKEYLLEFTQKFAELYLQDNRKRKFKIDKVYFNYETESFVAKEYTLPCIWETKKIKGNDVTVPNYLILTPIDILRKGELYINLRDFANNYELICNKIDNEELRSSINNYLSNALKDYISNRKNKKKRPSDKQIAKVEQKAFKEFSKKHTEIYDYYIKYKESDSKEIEKQKTEALKDIHDMCFNNEVLEMSKIWEEKGYDISFKKNNTFEEVQKRVKYFKDCIENNDCYKLFPQDTKEIVIQKSFIFVCYATFFKLDAEVNNGRGAADFIASFGNHDSVVIEFKLARHPRLKDVFKQVEIYKKANRTDKYIIVIFYFTKDEYNTAIDIIKDNNFEDTIDNNVFLIDCRRDNKTSASNVK